MVDRGGLLHLLFFLFLEDIVEGEVLLDRGFGGHCEGLGDEKDDGCESDAEKKFEEEALAGELRIRQLGDGGVPFFLGGGVTRRLSV